MEFTCVGESDVDAGDAAFARGRGALASETAESRLPKVRIASGLKAGRELHTLSGREAPWWFVEGRKGEASRRGLIWVRSRGRHARQVCV
jgi:hypothetical protein